MVTATEPAPVGPVDIWEGERVAAYSSMAAAAGSIAYNLLEHSARDGADITRVSNAERVNGLEADDMATFVWDTIQDAAAIGYMTAQINVKDDPDLTIEALARAVAALMGKPLIEQGQTFEPQVKS